MANNGNGRNVERSDENRPTWRPQDDTGRNRRASEDDDRERMMRDRDDERFMQRDRERYLHWDDRFDRDEGGYRSTERGGLGQSGYGAGRYAEDRSYPSRNQGGYPRNFDERSRGYERGYGYGENYLGQGGQQRPSHDSWGNEGYTGRGGTGRRDWQSYGNQGMRGYGYSEEQQRNWNQGGPRYQTGNWGNEGLQYGPSDSRVGGREFDQRDVGYSRNYGRPQRGFGGGHRGKGPSGFARSDERIKEMVCEVLTDHDDIDATHIDITVKNGEVVLAGTVEDRHQKRLAEDIVEQCAGVKDVQNQIRVGVDKKSSVKETDTSMTNQDKRGRA